MAPSRQGSHGPHPKSGWEDHARARLPVITAQLHPRPRMKCLAFPCLSCIICKVEIITGPTGKHCERITPPNTGGALALLPWHTAVRSPAPHTALHQSVEARAPEHTGEAITQAT